LRRAAAAPEPAHLSTAADERTRAPQSVPYNVIFNGFNGPAEEIPSNNTLVAPPPGLGPYTPWSVHTELAEGSTTGSVWVSWSSGLPSLVNNPAQVNQSLPGANPYLDDYPQAPTYAFRPQTPDPASVASVVQWGTATGAYTNNATGTARAYIQVPLRPRSAQRHAVRCAWCPLRMQPLVPACRARRRMHACMRARPLPCGRRQLNLDTWLKPGLRRLCTALAIAVRVYS